MFTRKVIRRYRYGLRERNIRHRGGAHCTIKITKRARNDEAAVKKIIIIKNKVVKR
jgi:hypothetical protein